VLGAGILTLTFVGSFIVVCIRVLVHRSGGGLLLHVRMSVVSCGYLSLCSLASYHVRREMAVFSSVCLSRFMYHCTTCLVTLYACVVRARAR
jgi:hypothetical protein